MLIQDQISARMRQLGVDGAWVAKQLEVSEQTVRHWLSGRNRPGKEHGKELERVLGFKIDYSEGENDRLPEMTEFVDRKTIEALAKMTPRVRRLFSQLALALSEAQA